jgi:hypothetical protein
MTFRHGLNAVTVALVPAASMAQPPASIGSIGDDSSHRNNAISFSVSKTFGLTS